MDHLSHHTRNEYCRTRLKYRDSKQPTAVKVYTVADESKYLLVFGVPKINLLNEVKKEFQKFGPLRNVCCVTEELTKHGSGDKIEIFTDCFKVVFEKLEHARRAKKFVDAKNFYGGVLHVSYAPECEMIEELRQKLNQRKAEVRFRINLHSKSEQNEKKRKQHFSETEENTTTKRFKND